MASLDDKTQNSDRYNAKLKRVNDAIALKTPDRVPIIAGMQAFIPHYGKITLEEAMRDYDKAEKAFDKFYEDFDPDLAWDPTFMYPINAFETLGLKYMRWPGNILGPNTLYQFIEGEYMLSDEYDELIEDPTRYILTKWIPRCFGNLKGLENLTGLSNSIMYGFMGSFTPFARPDVQSALKALVKAGEELTRWGEFLARYDAKLIAKGFPIAYGAYRKCALRHDRRLHARHHRGADGHERAPRKAAAGHGQACSHRAGKPQ